MKYLNLIFLFLFLAGSSPAQTKSAAKPKPTPKKVAKSTKNKILTVSGKVTHTYQYCGGAEPSPEQLAELQSPKPYSGKKFYVRKGNVNTTKADVVASFVTDDNGAFSIQLPPGTYAIIVEEQLNTVASLDLKKNYPKIDMDCLNKWWNKPYHTLQLGKNVTDLNFNFKHRCFIDKDIPCLYYDGPMPP